VYRKILLAYDGSEAGQQALLESQEIGQWSRAQMRLIAVMPSPAASLAVEAWAYAPVAEADDRARYQATLDAGVQRLREAGLDASGELAFGPAVDEVVRAAREFKADLMVLGHQHRDSWAERWWRGSLSKNLVEHAPCSVLVVVRP
jgi:nucleotide-binding universal stress UspA family protein